MTESGSHHLKRGEKFILSSIRQALEKELGRKLDYRDQPRIDAELEAHGIHFNTVHHETASDYQQAARNRGLGTIRKRRSGTDTHPGD
jgi:hypothetical protein